MDFAPRRVSRPARPLPPGACDAHSHVFGPYERFPLYSGRRYTPPPAPVADYVAMLDSAGFSHGVLVHPSASGWDCGCTLDALELGNGRLRGIVVVPPSASDAQLQSMHARGVRGIRFTETGERSRGPQPAEGVLGLHDLEAFGGRLRELGWHAQIWAKCEMIVAAAPGLLRHDIPLVIDHMGFFDVARGVEDADFQSFLALVSDGRWWVKLSACRVSKRLPDCEDVRPFHEALLRAAPDRLLWGSDWPYIGLDPHPPDVGHLVDLFDAFTVDATLREKIFIRNPAALYGF
jgi:2-pyrone-4,6-dicarboxylate lactonase